MTKPEPVFPGACTLATRRAIDRRYYVMPDERGRRAYLYPTGVMLERTKVRLVAACQMCNHIHEVLYDPEGERTRFLEARNGIASRSFNVLRGRKGYLLQAPSPKDKLLLADARAVLNAVVYTLVNPVEAGLVDWPHEWPGTVGDWRNILSGPPVEVVRPTTFYKQGAKSHMPEVVSIELVMPPVFARLGLNEAGYEALVREEVGRRCREIHSRRTRPALGAERALSVSPHSRPGTEEEEAHEALDTRRFRGDPATVELQVALWTAFLSAYALARERRLGGDPAVFPFGTDRYRHKENASVVPDPPKEAAYLFS